MIEHYKKTFGGMQAVIGLITAIVYFGVGHRLAMTAVFFAIMQLGAVLGAFWAVRLKRKMTANVW